MTATGVYPRTRGEAVAVWRGDGMYQGLPPHTRGSLGRFTRDADGTRSTPAHAGKPLQAFRSRVAIAVYPRTRGEALNTLGFDALCQGLPPHTRGSLTSGTLDRCCSGSTPAHAGKPARNIRRRTRCTVYPRTRGEAIALRNYLNAFMGLPPHTRGSPVQHVDPVRRGRSTPAHAGKPRMRGRRPIPTRVYPRTRGEALGDR